MHQHFADTDVEYSSYHFNSFQIFISNSDSLETAISKIDAFLKELGGDLAALNYSDDSSSKAEPIRLVLQLESEKNPTYTDALFPSRLISNLLKTGIAIEFC